MSAKTKTAVQRSGKISKPAALKPGHLVAGFDCGRAQINDWLRNQAKKATDADTARTVVVCRGSKRVVGYYALAAGAVERALAPGALRRNVPDPIPVVILARLGIDQNEQGRGLGEELLGDAMKRALQAARIIGARALLVHALDAKAAQFYKDRGFQRLNAEEQTLFISMREIRDALS